jgi:hypothetical protein
MQTFDASSTLYAWDNYPVDQFPGLWKWIGNLIATGEIVFPAVAFTEIGHKAPECCDWLDDQGAQKIAVSNAIAQAALAMKAALEIENDEYGTGVDENDLFVIATAKTLGCTLISDEAIQAPPPQNKKKYKIPAVCAMDVAKVDCLNFVAFFKQSGRVF